ncbi:MAG: DegQ family serine endoprotease [Gammaproteobacteria bacterium]|nr:DegQ family serine endoprotease [Gammaproteobacteria bacterium]
MGIVVAGWGQRIGAGIIALGLMMSGADALAAARELPDFTKLVEQHSAAVVNISTTQKHRAQGPSSDEAPAPPRNLPPGVPFDDFLRRFFGDGHGGGGHGGGRDGGPDFDSESLGSGVVISREGYILTNRHVIDEADEIVVRLSDRREFLATVVGSDKRSDVALLKIKADNLPVAKIGQSRNLKVGEWVLAIGSPFGFDHTVTAGIVSAIGRSLPNENYVPFIQTDVAINPGNSGGPLYNLDGEVIGINSQIYSRTGGFMGLSFAIPIDMAMNVVDQLKSSGHVKRGWLGILIQDVTRELAESFGMAKPSGALVAKILPNSPAGKAGLQVGDVVVEFDGHEVGSSSELPPLVGGSRIGASLPVKIIRNGKPLTLSIVINELPENDDIELSDDGRRELKLPRLDIAIADMTSEQQAEYEDLQQGVFVTQVDNGAGAHAGLRRGDVIVKLNNVDVKDAQQLKKIVDELPAGKSVPILVMRRSGPVFLAIRIPKN